jgi:hypothetical protein
MEQDVQQILDGIRAVMEKSLTNAEFRQMALSDAAAAINEASGYTVPAKARIRFVEETEDLVVTLPPFQGEGVEISEATMAEISAGHNNWTHINCLHAGPGKPAPDFTRGGEDVYIKRPQWLTDTIVKVQSWFS